MDPAWMISLTNVLAMLLLLAIPVLIIALGVSLGLRLTRGASTNTKQVSVKSRRNLYLLIGVFSIAILFLLSLTIAIPPGQAPLPFLLPMLLIVLAQLAFWVLVIAGVVWLVLWLARRAGVIALARETPLDVLKMRYARGEITKAQFEEMKRDLNDP